MTGKTEKEQGQGNATEEFKQTDARQSREVLGQPIRTKREEDKVIGRFQVGLSVAKVAYQQDKASSC